MEGQFSFQLNITQASGVKEIAGELWDIAKSLREGTMKQSYGNDKTPCKVDWEVRQIVEETTTSTSTASASTFSDGTSTAESKSSKTTTIKTELLTKTVPIKHRT